MNIFDEIKEGNIGAIELLAKDSDEFLIPEEKNNVNPLQFALQISRDPKFIALLIAKGAMKNKNHQDNEKRSLAHYVAFNGNKDILDIMLTHDLDFNHIDDKKISPLWFAIRYGTDPESIRKLITQGKANINYINGDGNNAIQLALIHKKYDFVNELLALGGIAADQESQPLLNFAISNDNSLETISLLIKAGCNLTGLDHNRCTALQLAIINKNVDVVRILLNNKVRIDLPNETEQKNILHFAIANQMPIDVIEKLVSLGADPNSVDKDARTPLNYALDYQMEAEDIEKLLKLGASPNSTVNLGRSILQHAVRVGAPISVIETLVKSGANPVYQNKNGMNILHYAVDNNRGASVIKKLIELGADQKQGDNLGRTPLHRAVYQGSLNAAEALIANGVDVNQPDFLGRSAFLLAVNKGHQNLIHFFYNNCKNINTQLVEEAIDIDRILVARGFLPNSVDWFIEGAKYLMKVHRYDDAYVSLQKAKERPEFANKTPKEKHRVEYWITKSKELSSFTGHHQGHRGVTEFDPAQVLADKIVFSSKKEKPDLYAIFKNLLKNEVLSPFLTYIAYDFAMNNRAAIRIRAITSFKDQENVDVEGLHQNNTSTVHINEKILGAQGYTSLPMVLMHELTHLYMNRKYHNFAYPYPYTKDDEQGAEANYINEYHAVIKETLLNFIKYIKRSYLISDSGSQNIYLPDLKALKSQTSFQIGYQLHALVGKMLKSGQFSQLATDKIIDIFRLNTLYDPASNYMENQEDSEFVVFLTEVLAFGMHTLEEIAKSPLAPLLTFYQKYLIKDCNDAVKVYRMVADDLSNQPINKIDIKTSQYTPIVTSVPTTSQKLPIINILAWNLTERSNNVYENKTKEAKIIDASEKARVNQLSQMVIKNKPQVIILQGLPSKRFINRLKNKLGQDWGYATDDTNVVTFYNKEYLPKPSVQAFTDKDVISMISTFKLDSTNNIDIANVQVNSKQESSFLLENTLRPTLTKSKNQWIVIGDIYSNDSITSTKRTGYYSSNDKNNGKNNIVSEHLDPITGEGIKPQVLLSNQNIPTIIPELDDKLLNEEKVVVNKYTLKSFEFILQKHLQDPTIQVRLAKGQDQDYIAIKGNKIKDTWLESVTGYNNNSSDLVYIPCNDIFLKKLIPVFTFVNVAEKMKLNFSKYLSESIFNTADKRASANTILHTLKEIETFSNNNEKLTNLYAALLKEKESWPEKLLNMGSLRPAINQALSDVMGLFSLTFHYNIDEYYAAHYNSYKNRYPYEVEVLANIVRLTEPDKDNKYKTDQFVLCLRYLQELSSNKNYNILTADFKPFVAGLITATQKMQAMLEKAEAQKNQLTSFQPTRG